MLLLAFFSLCALAYGIVRTEINVSSYPRLRIESFSNDVDGKEITVDPVTNRIRPVLDPQQIPISLIVIANIGYSKEKFWYLDDGFLTLSNETASDVYVDFSYEILHIENSSALYYCPSTHDISAVESDQCRVAMIITTFIPPSNATDLNKRTYEECEDCHKSDTHSVSSNQTSSAVAGFGTLADCHEHSSEIEFTATSSSIISKNVSGALLVIVSAWAAFCFIFF
ncbi:hypothetical protein CANCADRAFT_30170 [Tortispora caseinolytica NRRL Y-17796]|uniref:Uncharacterized protein n=1 Tax=Tortispora caseinolytica NRRL Y-17796 TaxID=767744 RepID=A0A1E4TJD4_9ASCO|nr:hypothetical protein CANCADRAFT_30170 [Tortispora caseinolytica NRRL Y-17796]